MIIHTDYIIILSTIYYKNRYRNLKVVGMNQLQDDFW